MKQKWYNRLKGEKRFYEERKSIWAGLWFVETGGAKINPSKWKSKIDQQVKRKMKRKYRVVRWVPSISRPGL